MVKVSLGEMEEFNNISIFAKFEENHILVVLLCLFLIALLVIWVLVNDSEKEKGNKIEEEG